jgi:hypothetical protein
VQGKLRCGLQGGGKPAPQAVQKAAGRPSLLHWLASISPFPLQTICSTLWNLQATVYFSSPAEDFIPAHIDEREQLPKSKTVRVRFISTIGNAPQVV